MHNTTFRALALVASISLPLAWACSSSDSPQAGDAGGGSSTSSGSGSGGTSSGSFPGVACYRAADKTCDIKGATTQANKDSANADCTSNKGTPVDHCPSDGLQGCCLIVGLGTCTYDAANASSLKSACGAGGTTWSTTAP